MLMFLTSTAKKRRKKEFQLKHSWNKTISKYLSAWKWYRNWNIKINRQGNVNELRNVVSIKFHFVLKQRTSFDVEMFVRKIKVYDVEGKFQFSKKIQSWKPLDETWRMLRCVNDWLMNAFKSRSKSNRRHAKSMTSSCASKNMNEPWNNQ